MTDLTKITTPFALLDQATKDALEQCAVSGAPLEYISYDGKWKTRETKTPRYFHPGYTYRAKPAPVVEKVTLRGGTYYFGGVQACKNAPYEITFNLVDGEVDCSSIKMEKL